MQLQEERQAWSLPRTAQRTPLRIGGVTAFSTTDYPGMLAAVVFCQGCTWRCHYCHNPHLLDATTAPQYTWAALREFLQRRRGMLDALVFSGGEPTLQPGLPEAMREARELGFRVGLHSAGMHPTRLERALPFADWVGLDVKAPFADYPAITGAPHGGEKVRESLRLVLASGVAHEARTTWHPELLGLDRLRQLADELREAGVRRWMLQRYRPAGCEVLDAVSESAWRACAELVGELAGGFEVLGLRDA